jgi:sorbitol-specific phosphotransferase system component IIA
MLKEVLITFTQNSGKEVTQYSLPELRSELKEMFSINKWNSKRRVMK